MRQVNGKLHRDLHVCTNNISFTVFITPTPLSRIMPDKDMHDLATTYLPKVNNRWVVWTVISLIACVFLPVFHVYILDSA